MSCEKEPEPEPEFTLKDVLVGDFTWDCSRQMVQSLQSNLNLKFTDEYYVLKVEFNSPLHPNFTSNQKNYTIFEDTRKIRLDYPYNNTSYLMEYEIVWNEVSPNVMTWMPCPENEKNLTDLPISLTWIKNE
jgi:hypothetical protein